MSYWGIIFPVRICVSIKSPFECFHKTQICSPSLQHTFVRQQPASFLLFRFSSSSDGW